MSESVAVIGGGLGGLAASCVLAARGHAVTLYERNSWLGGKAAVLSEPGFRFDMGPTILTLPSVLRRIFAEAGEELDERLEMVRLEPQWRCFYTDGATLDLTADAGVMARHLEAFAPGTATGYARFLALAERLHRVSDASFFWKPVGGLRDIFSARELFGPGMLGDVLALRWGRSVAATVRDCVPEPRVAQMLDHFT